MALQLSKNELKIRNYIEQSFKTIVKSTTLKIVIVIVIMIIKI